MSIRTSHYGNTLAPPQYRSSKNCPSTSTNESPDYSMVNKPDTKEKSQLCKRFMESGLCPYEKRCKFAHGSHELRKNDQINSKYKTKECGSFKANQFCIYGDRCNFIHITKIQGEPSPAPTYTHDFQFRLLQKDNQRESRLLQLL